MKRLLVTGCAGYIGGTFTFEALKRGYKVLGIDNFVNSTKKNLNRVSSQNKENFKFIELDLSIKSQKLKKNIDEFKPNYVVHFAGLKAVGESEDTPCKYLRNNLLSTLNVLESIPATTKFIFSSSATVYGDSKIQPLTEESKINTNSAYGSTKVASESVIQDFSRTKGIQSIILRYFNPIGSHKEYIIYEDFRNKPNNLMPRLIRSALKIDKEIKIFGNDYDTKDGTGERDYIHVSDLVNGHFAALDYRFNDENIKFFNLGTGEKYSVLELISTFNSVNKLEVRHIIDSRRKGDVEICYADSSLANNELNWKAEYNLSDMCKDSWEVIKRNGY